MDDDGRGWLDGGRALLERVHGWVLPPRCVLCLDPGRPPTLDLCPACEADLPVVGPSCGRCGEPTAEPERERAFERPARPAGGFADGWADERVDAVACVRCTAHPPPYAASVAAFRYAWPVDALVRGFKYQKRLSHGRVLGTLLAEAVLARHAALPDAIVPVPLHPARERERGYNQAWELARVAGGVLRVAAWPTACARVRETPPQAGLDAAARRTNVVGAFAVRRDVRGAHVAIVDDVMTTGATVAALAVALRTAGARRVDAWAVARA
jgi:ComF family protein